MLITFPRVHKPVFEFVSSATGVLWLCRYPSTLRSHRWSLLFQILHVPFLVFIFCCVWCKLHRLSLPRLFVTFYHTPRSCLSFVFILLPFFIPVGHPAFVHSFLPSSLSFFLSSFPPSFHSSVFSSFLPSEWTVVSAHSFTKGVVEG